MGWGRCLKATLQTSAPKNFCSRRWGAERRVSRAQTRERGPPLAQAEIENCFRTFIYREFTNNFHTDSENIYRSILLSFQERYVLHYKVCLFCYKYQVCLTPANEGHSTRVTFPLERTTESDRNNDHTTGNQELNQENSC